MNFLKIKTSWSNLELGLIKICVGVIYMIAGVYFHEFLANYLLILAAIFVITAIWTFLLWIKKMKEAKP